MKIHLEVDVCNFVVRVAHSIASEFPHVPPRKGK